MSYVDTLNLKHRMVQKASPSNRNVPSSPTSSARTDHGVATTQHHQLHPPPQSLHHQISPPPSPHDTHHRNHNQHSTYHQHPTYQQHQTHQETPFLNEHFSYKDFSIKRYLQTELIGWFDNYSGYTTENLTAVDNIKNFLSVPLQIESFVGLGFVLCIDAYLYILTFLPIRVIFSFIMLAFECINYVIPIAPFRSKASSNAGASDKKSAPTQLSSKKKVMKNKVNGTFFHRIQAYDIIRGALVLIGFYSLQLLNMSRVYHFIRGQSMIKLYVLTSMIEISDKLLCSFGQDAFDSLYVQTRLSYGLVNIFFSFIIVAVYVIIHSGLHFLYVATMTVAINSSDQALIIVLILNNFAEIKSFVFKKFDTHNLFQLACSEITERFNLFLSIFCITIVALSQDSFTINEAFPIHVKVMITMIICESIADWIKHAFINKFNNIKSSVYEDFSRVLRNDILCGYQDNQGVVENTHTLTKRIGLAQIPIVCNSLRHFKLALSSPYVLGIMAGLQRYQLYLLILFVFLGLVALKVVVGISLVLFAGRAHNRDLGEDSADSHADASADKEKPKSPVKPQKITTDSGKMTPILTPEKIQILSSLSSVDRYATHNGRVVG